MDKIKIYKIREIMDNGTQLNWSPDYLFNLLNAQNRRQVVDFGIQNIDLTQII